MNPVIIDLEDSPYSNDVETQGFELSSGGSWYYPINYPIREYQYKIVESALFTNTLVCLPTGLGKTFIAAVVIYNFFRWYPRGKIVFMAPTRPLVAQQINACHDIMGIPSSQTVELTGSINQTKRGESWIQKRVIFATPQIFHNDLEHNIVPRNDIKCVVIDEAHKALGNHAYCEAIRILSEDNKYFRILALSATPGNSIDKVREVVQKLKIANLELRDDTSSDIVPYVNERRIEIALVCLSKELITFKDRYVRIMDPHVKNLMKRGVINASTANISKGRIFFLLKSRQENHQPNSGNGMIQKTLTILMTMTHAYELLQRHGLRAFYNFYQNHSDKYWMEYENELKVLLQDIKNYLGDFPDVHTMPNGEIPKMPSNIVFGHTKFHKLREILELHFRNAASENRDTRSIVFVEFKDSVREVFVLLLQCRPLIRPQMFVGQSDQKQKAQLKALEDFKSNSVNVLISTSVGEEGLDVGEVDLIICFDGCQQNPSRLVQRMGRTGRKRTGQIFILVTDGKEYKDLKATLNKKDTFNSKVLQSSNIVSSMYQENPRMIPSQFHPTCRQIRFESQPKTPQEIKKRKKKVTVPVEKKKRVTNSKESPAQRSKPGPSNEPQEPVLSQGNQRLMNSFFTKPTAKKSKNFTNTKTFDDRAIKNSEVKLLNDDNMGLDFLTFWTMLNSKPKAPTREFQLIEYLPCLPDEEDDDFLSSYHPPDIEIFNTIANWTQEEVSDLNHESESEDEDRPRESIYDDGVNYSRSIIIQSPSSKYIRNDDDSMFPSDDLFEAIDEKAMMDMKSPATPLDEPDIFKTDDGFDTAMGENSIFSNLLDSSDEEESKRLTVTIANDLKVDENQTTKVDEDLYQCGGLFDHLLDDENEATVTEGNRTTETVGNRTEDGELYKSCGLFDNLLEDSSEEENSDNHSNMPVETFKPARSPEINHEPATISKSDIITKSKPMSSQVSQALLEIQHMTLEEEKDSQRPVISSSQPTRLNNNDPRTLPINQSLKPERQSQLSQANSTSRRIIESDSEEDMFIDDNFSENEQDKEPDVNISLVANTPGKKAANHLAPQSPIQKCQDVRGPLPRYSRLSLFGSKPKPAPTKPSKPSLSLTKNKPTIVDDDFDFSNIPVIAVDDTNPTSIKSKLSLTKLQSGKKVPSLSSNIGPSSNKESTSNKEPVRSMTSSQSFRENNKTQKSFTFASKNIAPKSKQSNPQYSSFFPKPSTSTWDHSPNPKSDIENERKHNSYSDDDEFVRPMAPTCKKSPLVMKNHIVNDRSPERKKVKVDDIYYGTPSRKDWLAKKRKERHRKKMNSPKKGRGFIVDEAEVSIDVDTTDGSSASDEDEEMNGFVSNTQYLDESHMQAVYLKSTRSPVKPKYLINQNKYLPKAMVMSQPFTQGPDEYVNDSFCVDEDEEIEEEYDEEERDFVVDEEEFETEESDLERMERLMEEERKRKRSKSDERKAKKRKKNWRASNVHSDSSSEDETEKLRRQIAEESMIMRSKK